MKEILVPLFWAVVGIILTILLDKPLKRRQRQIYWWWKDFIKKHFKTEEGITRGDYTVGKWSTGWFVVEGSTTPMKVQCHYDRQEITPPKEIDRRMIEIEKEQSVIKKAGGFYLHNGPTVALGQVTGRAQTGPLEEIDLSIRLRPSKYFMFVATANRLDEKFRTETDEITSLREMYLKNVNYSAPLPELANVFAVQMCVLTNDGYFVISKRASEGIVGYPGYLAPALNECIHPIKDLEREEISLYRTVCRAAKDELNIDITEDEVEFFTIGVDIKEYMYTLTGLVRSKKFSRDYMRMRRTQGAPEGFEAEKYFFLPHNLKIATKMMSDLSKEHKWSPYGIVCITQALIAEFGRSQTEKYLSKHLRYDKE